MQLTPSPGGGGGGQKQGPTYSPKIPSTMQAWFYQSLFWGASVFTGLHYRAQVRSLLVGVWAPLSNRLHKEPRTQQGWSLPHGRVDGTPLPHSPLSTSSPSPRQHTIKTVFQEAFKNSEEGFVTLFTSLWGNVNSQQAQLGNNLFARGHRWTPQNGGC